MTFHLHTEINTFIICKDETPPKKTKAKKKVSSTAKPSTACTGRNVSSKRAKAVPVHTNVSLVVDGCKQNLVTSPEEQGEIGTKTGDKGTEDNTQICK